MKNDTSTSPAAPAPTPAHPSQPTLWLEPSGRRLLWVTEGSELRGLSGPLQILLYPGQPDRGQPIQLQTAQGWRCPGTGWVSLHNPGVAACRGRWHMVAEHEALPAVAANPTQTQKSRPGLRTWGRLMGAWLTAIRPGRRAT